MRTRWCTFQARYDEVQNIFREVMVAGRNEGFLSIDPECAIACRCCLCSQEPQICAAVSLSQAHRAGPYSFHHFWQVHVANLVRCRMVEQMIGAAAEFRIQLEGDIGRPEHFVDQVLQDFGKTLPTVIRVGINADPAVFDELFIGLFESRRSADCTVLEYCAMLIAFAIDGQEFTATKSVGFFKDGFNQVDIDLLVAW